MGICRFPHRFMVYQPIVDLRSGRVIYYEALFRPGGDACTQRVCHQAEQEGWIIDVDLYALHCAQQVLRDNPGISLAINVSAASIATYPARILRQLDQDSANCARLIFEITESQQVDAGVLRAFAEACRKRHVGIAQDDFGIEFSTVERARLLRPCVLKVVAPLRADRLEHWGRTELRAAAAVADEIGALLLVERIECERAELIALRHGARAGQGYAYGKPDSLPSLALCGPATPAPVRRAPSPAMAWSLVGKCRVLRFLNGWK